MRELRLQVAAIRSGLSHRLSGKFPDEVTPLVEELNALLEHNAAMVERASTRVGDLAHALKTPLTVLWAELQSADGPSPDVMKQEIVKIRRQVDHQLARAAASASAKAVGVQTPVTPVVQAIRRSLERIHAERAIKISLSGDAATFRGQREDLEEVAGNLIENAYKWARSEVSVKVSTSGQKFVLTIDDDGPGLAPEQRTSALVRGARLDETAPGSGLGLAIVRDIVDAYGGRFDLDASPAGGLRAMVELPCVE
jgi:signal transduction histidine kinase